ncbi:MAG: V-type ATP synthase subunit F [Acidilobaceae archaeon]
MSRVEKGKVVVIGDRDTLPLFKSAGFKVLEAYSQSQALDIISRLELSDDVALIIVLKHILDDVDRFKIQTLKFKTPVFILPTSWSPGESVDVNRLIAKALGVG